LRPAGRFLALLGLAPDLTQNTINAVNVWPPFAPLTLLGGSPDLAAVPHSEVVALARLALKWHNLGFQIALTFFGFALLIEGYLIFRSRLFSSLARSAPRLGRCLLSDQQFRLLGLPVSPYILYPCPIGEGALCLWLLVVGVNETKWRAIMGAT
jgi:hypothetical protein